MHKTIQKIYILALLKIGSLIAESPFVILRREEKETLL